MMKKTLNYLVVLCVSVLIASCQKDTGINVASTMQLYPNPCNYQFNATIYLSKPEDFTLKVYNANGVLIKSLPITNKQINNNISVNVSAENDGIMYVVAEIPSGNLTQKILKVK
jgi:hypothetical protein